MNLRGKHEAHISTVDCTFVDKVRDRELLRPVRIGVDGRRLGVRPKGIGRYILELCKALDVTLPEAWFVLYTPRPIDLPRISPRWSVRVDQSLLGRLSSNLWLTFGTGLLARRDKLDCFWSGSGLLPLVGLRLPRVLTVHDLVHRIAPATMDSRALLAARLFFRLSVARADAVVTNSEATAKRLREHFGRETAAVVRPGLSAVFGRKSDHEVERVLQAYGVKKPFVLGVGTWEPRKGLDTLVRTFVGMKALGCLENHKLVLAGERGWKDGSIRELVGRNSDSVMSLGFVDDSALAALYQAAEVFVFPSRYEGFGMPVLEARACGAAVVTSDIPELREAGGDYCNYVEPTEDGVRRGILSALRQRRVENCDWRHWSWEESARILARVLLDASDKRPFDAAGSYSRRVA